MKYYYDDENEFLEEKIRLQIEKDKSIFLILFGIFMIIMGIFYLGLFIAIL